MAIECNVDPPVIQELAAEPGPGWRDVGNSHLVDRDQLAKLEACKDEPRAIVVEQRESHTREASGGLRSLPTQQDLGPYAPCQVLH